MSFVVYTHSEEQVSRIHHETCSQYQRRKTASLPPSRWYGPYMTFRDAREQADRPTQTWTVRGCQKCGTDAQFS